MGVHIGAFETASIVVAAAAVAGYLNHLTFKLPQTIALTLTGAVASAVVALADAVLPGTHLIVTIRGFMDNIDFNTAVPNQMLSILLFVGALAIDIDRIRKGTC